MSMNTISSCAYTNKDENSCIIPRHADLPLWWLQDNEKHAPRVWELPADLASFLVMLLQ